MKICRQHDSHGPTLTATAASSSTVCSIYSSVHDFTARNGPRNVLNHNSRERKTAVLLQTAQRGGKVVLSKNEPENVGPGGSRAGSRTWAGNSQTNANSKKFRIDSSTQYTVVGFTRSSLPSPTGFFSSQRSLKQRTENQLKYVSS